MSVIRNSQDRPGPFSVITRSTLQEERIQTYLWTCRARARQCLQRKCDGSVTMTKSCLTRLCSQLTCLLEIRLFYKLYKHLTLKTKKAHRDVCLLCHDEMMKSVLEFVLHLALEMYKVLLWYVVNLMLKPLTNVGQSNLLLETQMFHIKENNGLQI